jgi:hypothetical protein
MIRTWNSVFEYVDDGCKRKPSYEQGTIVDQRLIPSAERDQP